MNILAVDTAGKTLGVALLQDDRLKYECYLDGGMTHSETLMPLVDHCLKLCGLTCADIDLFGVNAGPGSFTGLRIGLAAVKGLAFPRETLCAPVSTLEALAAAHTGEYLWINGIHRLLLTLCKLTKYFVNEAAPPAG